MLSQTTTTKLIEELKREQSRDSGSISDKSIDYSRIIILPSGHFDAEEIDVARAVKQMVEMRQRYVFQPAEPESGPPLSSVDRVSAAEDKTSPTQLTLHVLSQFKCSKAVLRDGVFRVVNPQGDGE